MARFVQNCVVDIEILENEISEMGTKMYKISI